MVAESRSRDCAPAALARISDLHHPAPVRRTGTQAANVSDRSVPDRTSSTDGMQMRDQRDPLKALQDWYASQCDGQWEHQYGIKIGTLDNPGWTLRIDLSATALAERPFTEVKVQGDDDDDWCHCHVRGKVFEAFCGPNHLEDVIAIFLAWAITAARGAQH